nr:hypothetical protein HK105_007935 [Polyrhizophydium stewartii]
MAPPSVLLSAHPVAPSPAAPSPAAPAVPFNPALASEIESSLIAQARELQFMLVEEQTKRRALESQLASAHANIEKLTKQNEQLTRKSARNADVTWNLEVESSDLQQLNARLTADIERLRRESRQTRSLVQQQKEQIELASARENELARECENLRGQLNAERRKSRRAIADLQRERTEAVEKLAEFERKADAAPWLRGPRLVVSLDAMGKAAPPLPTQDGQGRRGSAERPDRDHGAVAEAAAAAEGIDGPDGFADGMDEMADMFEPSGMLLSQIDLLALEESKLELIDANSRIQELQDRSEAMQRERDELQEMLMAAQEELHALHDQHNQSINLSDIASSIGVPMLSSTPVPPELPELSGPLLKAETHDAGMQTLALEQQHAFTQTRTPSPIATSPPPATAQQPLPKEDDTIEIITTVTTTTTTRSQVNYEETTVRRPRKHGHRRRSSKTSVDATVGPSEETAAPPAGALSDETGSAISVNSADEAFDSFISNQSHQFAWLAEDPPPLPPKIKALTDVDCLTQTMVGSYVKKFSRYGTHPKIRFCWVDPSKARFCWSENPSQDRQRGFSARRERSCAIQSVVCGMSPLAGNRNFLPSKEDAITVIGTERKVMLLPLSWEEHDKWLRGLSKLVTLMRSSTVPIDQQIMAEAATHNALGLPASSSGPLGDRSYAVYISDEDGAITDEDSRVSDSAHVSRQRLHGRSFTTATHSQPHGKVYAHQRYMTTGGSQSESPQPHRRMNTTGPGSTSGSDSHLPLQHHPQHQPHHPMVDPANPLWHESRALSPRETVIAGRNQRQYFQQQPPPPPTPTKRHSMPLHGRPAQANPPLSPVRSTILAPGDSPMRSPMPSPSLSRSPSLPFAHAPAPTSPQMPALRDDHPNSVTKIRRIVSMASVALFRRSSVSHGSGSSSVADRSSSSLNGSSSTLRTPI